MRGLALALDMAENRNYSDPELREFVCKHDLKTREVMEEGLPNAMPDDLTSDDIERLVELAD